MEIRPIKPVYQSNPIRKYQQEIDRPQMQELRDREWRDIPLGDSGLNLDEEF